MAPVEREFRAQTAEGELVGWLRETRLMRPNALLLHGGPGLSEYLVSLADELDGLMTTARYQQRGLAPSAIHGRRDIEGSVADAVAVMDALGWQRPLVVGHSWGGHLAMHLAVARPDRIGALVILDALGPVGDGGEASFRTRLRAGLSAAQFARLQEIEVLESPTRADLRDHLGILWANYFGTPAAATRMPMLEFAENTRETVESRRAHLAKGTLERGLGRVSAPTLVIHGSRSPIPLGQAQHIAALVPNATLVVHEGRGHWAWLEEPGFVRQQAAELLSIMGWPPVERAVGRRRAQ